MDGSPWPTSVDAFATINEGTTAFTASLLMELALTAEAIQLGIGANPYDLRTSHAYAFSFGSVGAAVLNRCRMEAGSATFGAGNNSVAVVFAHSTRFSGNPHVVLQRFGGTAPATNQAFEVGNITTTGFTAYRAQNAGAENVRYLAVQVPPS